jgi:heptosyltransferase-2
LRVAVAAFLAGIKSRIGMRGDGRGPLLTDPIARQPRGALHYCEEALQLGGAWASRFGVADWQERRRGVMPRLPGCKKIPSDPAACRAAPVWVFAPGATYGEAKSWPAEEAARFLELAVSSENARVVLVGDRSARAYVTALRRQARLRWREELDSEPGLVDLVGRTDLPQVVAILKAAAVFVGIDSGLMHLAAALGIPTLGLFGSSDPAWTGPRGVRTAVMKAEGFDCQPCFRRRCNQETFCMATLSADAVLAAARELLAHQLEEPAS